MLDFITKQDDSSGPGGEMTAEEDNNRLDEIKNAVTTSGQTLDNTGVDVKQFSKAMANYSGISDFYSASGTVNARLLDPISPFEGPTAYVDGLHIRVNISAGNDNTGAMTVNINGLGVKSVRINGAVLTGGEFVGDVELGYDSSNDWFAIIQSGDPLVGIITTGDGTKSLRDDGAYSAAPIITTGDGTKSLRDDGTYKVSGETGTWTPTNSQGATIGLTFAVFARTGNLVLCEARISITKNAASGGILIGGLPFDVASSFTGVGHVTRMDDNGTLVRGDTIIISVVNNDQVLFDIMNTNDYTNLQFSEVPASTIYDFSIIYHTDE